MTLLGVDGFDDLFPREHSTRDCAAALIAWTLPAQVVVTGLATAYLDGGVGGVAAMLAGLVSRHLAH